MSQKKRESSPLEDYFFYDRERNRYFPRLEKRNKNKILQEISFSPQVAQFSKGTKTASLKIHQVPEQAKPLETISFYESPALMEENEYSFFPASKQIFINRFQEDLNSRSLHSFNFDSEAFFFSKMPNHFLFTSMRKCSLISDGDDEQFEVTWKVEMPNIFACASRGEDIFFASSGKLFKFSMENPQNPITLGQLVKNNSDILALEAGNQASSSSQILIGCRNGQVGMVDWRSKSVEWPLKLPKCAISTLKLLSESNDAYLLTGSSSDRLFLWDLRFSREPLMEYLHFNDVAWNENVVIKPFIAQVSGARNTFWASRNNNRVLVKYEEAVTIERRILNGKVVACGAGMEKCLFICA